MFHHISIYLVIGWIRLCDLFCTHYIAYRNKKKKQKQIALAKAERLRQAQSDEVDHLQARLVEERTFQPKTAGELMLQDRFLVNQFYALCQSEETLQVRDENVQVCQEALIYARQQSKITERLIETMEEKIALENKRKQDKETDDLGVMAWWRNHGLP